jgi:hypothetical protein
MCIFVGPPLTEMAPLLSKCSDSQTLMLRNRRCTSLQLKITEDLDWLDSGANNQICTTGEFEIIWTF